MKKAILLLVLSFSILHFPFSILEAQMWKEIMDSTNFYKEKQDFETALKWAKLALSQAEKEFGKNDTNYISALGQIPELFYHTGQLDSAVLYQEIHLKLCRTIYKVDNPKLACSLDNLAVIYSDQGRFAEAEPLYKEALAMRRRLYRGDHPELAVGINNMACFLEDRGSYEEAEPLYKEALDMRRRLYKGNHPDLAMSINNLAEFLRGRGSYEEAEPLYKEALEMSRRLYNGDNSDLAMNINNMAEFLSGRGRYAEAEPLYKEALDMRRRLHNGDNHYLSNSINNMAAFLSDKGSYAEAEPLYKEALEMTRRLYKGDHPDLASSINNMAAFLNGRGRYAEAEPLYKEALEMSRRLYKGDNPDLARIINNMAAFLYGRGRYIEAETLFKEALEMFRRLFKGDHPNLAQGINNMAMFLDGRGRYSEAEPLYKESLEMRRHLYKGDHPDLALGINNMAVFLDSRGRYAEAKTLFKEALEMFRRLYKGDHPDLALSINNMAVFLDSRGRYTEAQPLYLEAHQVYNKVLTNYFPSLSEKEKMLFWNTMSSNFEVFNSFTIKREKENPYIVGNMYDNQLLTKGMLLNSMIKVKNRILISGNNELIRKYEDWQFLKNNIAKLQTQSLQDLTKQGINLDSVLNVANDREKELSRISEDFKKEYEKKEIKWQDVKKLLSENEAAVEIVRFKLYDKRLTDTIYYAALIIKEDSKFPEFVVLKNGNDLEREYINLYRKQTEEQKKSIFDSKKIISNLVELYNQFWSPIQEKLNGIQTVYLSPDGVYNQINLNTLVNPKTGKYLLEELDLRLVTSTRNLVDRNPLSPTLKKGENTAVLFGDPQFNLDTAKYEKLVSTYVRNKTRDYYYIDNLLENTKREGIDSLPGTRLEVEKISNEMTEKGWKVEKYLGADALEEAVKAVDNPRVLHIATHGKFLSDVEIKGERSFGIERQAAVENPLLRSFLLFAGAENTLNGHINQNTDDGLLTAYEAMNLNLDNTELVVLSACETGLGEVRNGEGVYGLQRAFQVAGAKSLIMSLWTVGDEATQKLMTSFYDKWLSGMSKREAFREAQMELKKKYPGFYYWGAFVMLGE